MSTLTAENLSGAVNNQARQHYSALAKQLGNRTLLSSLAPRLALRRETPYPYRFVKSDSFYPQTETGFGRVIEASRGEGLQEIHKVVQNADAEHGWLFIPKTSQWLDTTLRATGADVETDQYAQTFLSHLFPTIEAVHTHPNKVVEELAQTTPWAYSENYLLEAARPSASDFIHHRQMVARSATGSLLTSSVVSHYGVTSFTSNNDFEGFNVDSRDWLIRAGGEPTQAIRAGLQKVASTITFENGTSAVNINFEPLST